MKNTGWRSFRVLGGVSLRPSDANMDQPKESRAWVGVPALKGISFTYFSLAKESHVTLTDFKTVGSVARVLWAETTERITAHL